MNEYLLLLLTLISYTAFGIYIQKDIRYTYDYLMHLEIN